jgi:hypothetical protein
MAFLLLRPQFGKKTFLAVNRKLENSNRNPTEKHSRNIRAKTAKNTPKQQNDK